MATTSIPEQYVVANLPAALTERLHPTVMAWNRLEGRPRRDDFSRALKAEVRDALWMFAKQWQLGEFQADDAGSPVFAKLRLRSSPMTGYQAGNGAVGPLRTDIPLEAQAEQRPLSWSWNQQTMRLDLRAQLGRQWRRMLLDTSLGAYETRYRTAYPFELPAKGETTDYVYAHRTSWQQLAALSGRAIDGGALHLHLANNANKASDGIALDAPGDAAKLDALGAEFEQWFAAQYLQPVDDGAWNPEYLEYQFECTATQAEVPALLTADGYAQGHLDWYSFDRTSAPNARPPDTLVADEITVTPFIPTPVVFEGMPNPRWWALEDRKTDFGNVSPSTTDLAQLLLMEFALVYANDWFVVPCRLPVGTLARVEGLAVTNNFGERFWVLAAGTGPQDDWHRWAMFQISSTTSAGTPDTSLFIPPTTTTVLDGDDSEEIELVRDEVANMAWAIERTVPSLTGVGRAGKDEARETLQYQQGLVAATSPAPIDYQAAIAYQAITGVPENWIPFVPVHVPNSVRQIQLQRSRMLRTIEGDPLPPEKVPPRTTLIRQGLDVMPTQPYFVHEEEVPRSGAVLSESFRRTRWTGGQAVVWLGVQKQVGRGERLSGLAFDSIADTAAQSV